jgi:molybdenum cofactor biosynthesis enzyme MoaA
MDSLRPSYIRQRTADGSQGQVPQPRGSDFLSVGDFRMPFFPSTTESLVRLNRAIKNNSIKFFAVYIADVLGLRYTIVRFDPISACNLRCQMCYFSDPHWLQDNRGKFSREEIEKIAREFFPRALQLYVGCSMEPTVYKDFPSIIKMASTYRVPFISMVSNGQLITEAHLNQLIDHGLKELTLSTHGVRRETYERLMVNASYDKFLTLLSALKRLKQAKGSSTPRLRLNYTVNPDNLAELQNFFDVFGEFEVATLQVRPIIDLGNVAYKNKDMTPFLTRYNGVLESLAKECSRRGIRLLFNRWDPTYAAPNTYAPVYTSVVRFVRPGKVWDDGYNIMEESYEAFSKRSGFRERMLRFALGRELIPLRPTYFASSEVL